MGISIVEIKNCLSVGLIPSKYSGKAVGSSNIEIYLGIRILLQNKCYPTRTQVVGVGLLEKTINFKIWRLGWKMLCICFCF